MPKPWRLAKSLVQLREQVNQLWPERAKESDGSIGDAAHAARTSDHNPWLNDHLGQPVVTAIDITNDPIHGPEGQKLADQLILDDRVKYVIFNARIWKARTRAWEPYHGPNAHRHHVHVSVLATEAAYDNPFPWQLSPLTP